MERIRHLTSAKRTPAHRTAVGILKRFVALATVLAIASLLALPGLVLGEGAAGPQPPGGLEVFPRQEDLGRRVTLTWNHRPECAGYRVYRSGRVDGPYECVGGVSASTMEAFPFFLDDKATGGNTYYYRVSAMDANWQEGPPCAPVQVKTKKYRRASQLEKSFIVSLADQRVYCFENGVIVNILRCSTGTYGTPTGNYHIFAHRRYVYGATYVCEYWMDWKTNYGMHSWPRYADGYGDYEESLGEVPRSHGCIRLHPLEAYWPYDWAPDGTPITIIGESFGRLPLKGMSCSAGAPAPCKTWYFPEGYSAADYNEYLLLFNTGPNPISARTYYYPEGLKPVIQTYELPPGSRRSISVNSVAGLPHDLGHSTKIIASGPMVAQQSMYFNIDGKRGGTTSIGATSASRSWNFAEGYAGNLFNMYLILFNPNSKKAKVHVTYFVGGGQTYFQDFTIPPTCRSTTLVNAVPGCDGREVSMRVESSPAIVAERSMYFDWTGNPNFVNGGDTTMGVKQTARTWYFAEGYTSDLFDEYILMLNPTGQLATVTTIFYTPYGPLAYRFNVAPFARGTLHVNSLPGLDAVENSVIVDSDTGIVVERAMYCKRDSRRGGDVSTGVSATSQDWYFAEGYTGGTFDEYVMVMNPGPEFANAYVLFHLENGADAWRTFVVAPQSRFTVHVNDLPEVAWTSHAVQVHSDKPVVAEQSEYFCMPQ